MMCSTARTCSSANRSSLAPCCGRRRVRPRPENNVRRSTRFVATSTVRLECGTGHHAQSRQATGLVAQHCRRRCARIWTTPLISPSPSRSIILPGREYASHQRLKHAEHALHPKSGQEGQPRGRQCERGDRWIACPHLVGGIRTQSRPDAAANHQAKPQAIQDSKVARHETPRTRRRNKDHECRRQKGI